jgi:hypothetical protein
LVSV